MPAIQSYTRTVLHHSKLILCCLLVLTAGFTFAFTRQTHNNHISIFFQADDPKYGAYQQFQEIFGNEEFAVVALEGEDLFSNTRLEAIRSLTDALERIPGVDRVVSLTNMEEFFGTEEAIVLRPIVPPGALGPDEREAVRERAMANEFVSDHLLSADGQMTALHVGLKSMGELEKRRTARAVWDTSMNVAGDRFAVYCSGSSFMEVELNRLSVQDFITFVPVVIVLIFIFLILLFRQLTLAVLCGINLLVILAWGMGLYVLCGERFNIITNVLGAILLAIGIADSVHILSHLKENWGNGGETGIVPSVRRTISKVWFPCLLTSLTTGAGFLSFIISDIRPVAVLGVFTAIGVMLGFFLSVTFLPAMMAVLDRRLIRALSSQRERTKPSRPDRFTRIMIGTGRFVIHAKTPLFIAFILIMAFSVAGIFRIRFDTNTIHYIPDENPVKSHFQVIEQHFGGTIPFVAWIQAKTGPDFTRPEAARMIESIENRLMKNENITGAFSITDYLKQFNQAINANDANYFRLPESRMDILDAYELGDPAVLDRVVSMDRRQTCIVFLTTWKTNEEGYRLNAEATALLEKTLGDGYAFHITGLSSLYLTMDHHLQKSQFRSFFIAFTIIFLMMLFVCGSLRLTVLSMVPNLFPIVLTLGLMGWTGIPLDVATTMIASVTIGIAVDDTIHFISWLRRNLKIEKDVEQAIIRTFADVGKPIVITSLLLCIGFIVLVLGSIVPTRMFGLLTAFSMAAALIGDLFVFPPLLLISKVKLPLAADPDNPTTLQSIAVPHSPEIKSDMLLPS